MNTSTPALPPREKGFDWPLCYPAEALVLDAIESFLRANPFARHLSERIRSETGGLLLDWVDHLVVPSAEAGRFAACGYTPDPLGECPPHQSALWHPEAMLPRVLLDRNLPPRPLPAVLAVRPEWLADFVAVHGAAGEPEGAPWTRYRRAPIAQAGDTLLQAVERRAYRGFLPTPPAPGATEALLHAAELWQTRRRQFENDAEGFRHSQALLDRIIQGVGRDLACHVVFAGERAYWQRRNRAARIQKARQDALGLGWGNHDHHTFRASRDHFVDLMQALEKLGFERRERFYAGEQAGWGAQVLEQPVEGIIAFCDVDLQPAETEIDFSRAALPPAARLGTIGLWVALHGESFLQAGMHHLECRFDFELLRDQLARENVATMKPFSDFPFLRQAFTEGERWAVNPERLQHLRQTGLVTAAQADRFLADGAIGSHLENLQRHGGFKGFNQKSVSVIIQATDPRAEPTH